VSVLQKRGIVAAMCMAAAGLAAALLLHAAGDWLVLADPLAPARAVVVLGGQLPFRAMEAAAVYKQGWAPEVWLTRGGIHAEDLALARLGIDKPAESTYSAEVLERLGVPSQAIRLLPGVTQNTADEVRVIAGRLRISGGDKVVLITSKYHTRRVKVLWHALIGNHPAAIVRYTPDDPFQAARWWRTTGDAMAVSREYFGILNAWTGFPIKSESW
jgi:uncharacterized SAM-binding protein YcdF (DUF218 family)